MYEQIIIKSEQNLIALGADHKNMCVVFWHDLVVRHHIGAARVILLLIITNSSAFSQHSYSHVEE